MGLFHFHKKKEGGETQKQEQVRYPKKLELSWNMGLALFEIMLFEVMEEENPNYQYPEEYKHIIAFIRGPLREEFMKQFNANLHEQGEYLEWDEELGLVIKKLSEKARGGG